MKAMTRPRLLAVLALSLLLLLLAACGGDEPAEPAAGEAAPAVEESMDDESMDDEMMDDEMMDDESMDDEMMDDEMMDDESMDDESMDDEMMDDESMDDEHNEMMDDESMDDESMGDDGMEAAMDQPEWMQIALTNALTGETFTLGSFSGRTVFVEPFATWCTNCRRQFTDLTATAGQFGDDVVIVAISVETTLSNEELVAYAEQTGFPFVFAVASQEMVRALAAEFGQTVANAPSTPHFIVRPDGSFTDLDTGFESADELAQQIRDAQG